MLLLSLYAKVYKKYLGMYVCILVPFALPGTTPPRTRDIVSRGQL